MRLFPLFLLLAACDGPGKDDTSTGTDDTSASSDEDGDGWTVAEGDCDDSEPTVHPDADELCNDVDDDCDDEIDEDGSATYYADADGDSFGDPEVTTTGCGAPDGYVEDSLDCDDADADAHPGATEVCDGDDDDCDGEADNAVGQTFYVDADADGYGGETTAELDACQPPEGYAADGGDCDDVDAAYHPGAAEEDCADPNDYNCDGSVGYVDADGDGFAACQDCDDASVGVNTAAVETCDGVDDDCDGTVDEDDAFDASTWYADADGDGYGDASVVVQACTQPSGYVADASDCDDTVSGSSPGGAEVCNGIDDDCDGTVDEPDATDAATWYTDADGDGFGDAASTSVACDAPAGSVADATDCDDTVATTFPGADETCDAADDDCDGTVDEDDAIDASTWYGDADGDGYGDDTVSTQACTAPAGHVADAGDCDDADTAYNPAATDLCTDPADYDCDGVTTYADDDADGFAACEDCDDADASVRPSGTETCDGIDDDCDGTVDEDDAVDAPTWYSDIDADGYGDPVSALPACTAPAGAVSDATDCDDTSAAVNPSEAETCNGVDDDCDTTVDEAGLTFYADADGDGYGDSATTADACAAPTGYVADDTDCDDAASAVNPAATETCMNGADDDCDEDPTDCELYGSDTVADADLTFSGTIASQYVGSAVAGMGDLDGDGTDDFVIGAYGYDGVGANIGRSYVYYGPVSASDTLATADAMYTGSEAQEWSGFALAIVGDTDGDGADDLLVGAYGHDQSSVANAGQAYLISGGHASGTGASVASTLVLGSTANQYVGRSVAAAGDVNGDGDGDFLVGAPGDATGGTASGAVGLWYGGGLASSETFGGADLYFRGTVGSDNVGWAVAGNGDLDGDGTPDLLIGAYGRDTGAANGGAAFVIYGPPSASVLTAAGADGTIYGTSASDLLGHSVAILGDTDGDGTDDFAVAADQADDAATDAGTVYVFTHAVTGSAAASTADATLTGEAASDHAGSTLGRVGDVNGDGFADLAVAASGFDDGARTDVGAVYLAWGPLTSISLGAADATRYGTAASDGVGYSIGGAGDPNGDGYSDVLFGAVNYDPASVSAAGRVWLYEGRGD